MLRLVRPAVALAALALMASTAPVAAQAGKRTNVLDANTATEAQLAAVPHMNAARAKALMAGRPFLSPARLEVFLGSQGLTPEQRKQLYGKLFVQINLNTATREEILLIPGMGNRMLREFEEYRPYKSLAVFHKEIDKYVDDAELARLEEYVFVPLDPNTATDEEMLTIPGAGNRIVREFKEYRPWKTVAQFRKEIGKYVPPATVAHFERYFIFPR